MTKKIKTITTKHKNITLHLDQEYKHLFSEIKSKIQTSRLSIYISLLAKELSNNKLKQVGAINY